jgi:hypothetical protein
VAEIGIWRGARAATRGTGLRVARSRRWAVQLWTWLHAQELLHGPAGLAAAAEDDRYRIRTGRG